MRLSHRSLKSEDLDKSPGSGSDVQVFSPSLKTNLEEVVTLLAVQKRLGGLGDGRVTKYPLVLCLP